MTTKKTTKKKKKKAKSKKKPTRRHLPRMKETARPNGAEDSVMSRQQESDSETLSSDAETGARAAEEPELD